MPRTCRPFLDYGAQPSTIVYAMNVNLPPGYNMALMYVIIGDDNSRHSTPSAAWEHWASRRTAATPATHAPLAALTTSDGIDGGDDPVEDARHDDGVIGGVTDDHVGETHATTEHEQPAAGHEVAPVHNSDEDGAHSLIQLANGIGAVQPTEVDMLLDNYNLQKYKELFRSKGLTNIVEHLASVTDSQLAWVGLQKKDRTKLLKKLSEDNYRCFASVDDRVCVYWEGDKKTYHGTVTKRSLTTTTILYDDEEEHEEANDVVRPSKCPRPGMCGVPGCVLADRHCGSCEIVFQSSRTRGR